MHVIIIGGFSNEGKLKVVQHDLAKALMSKEKGLISIILNDTQGTELDLSPSDYDRIQVLELTGGCLCCSMGSDLLTLLKVNLNGSETVLIEAAGICDIEQLKGLIMESIKAPIITQYVLDLSTLRPLLEIVPVLGPNIHGSDELFLFEADTIESKDLDGYDRLINGVDIGLHRMNVPSIPGCVLHYKR